MQLKYIMHYSVETYLYKYASISVCLKGLFVIKFILIKKLN